MKYISGGAASCLCFSHRNKHWKIEIEAVEKAEMGQEIQNIIHSFAVSKNKIKAALNFLFPPPR
jgi:hypothetical protein